MAFQEINERQLRLRWWAQRSPLMFRISTACLLFLGSFFLIVTAVLLPLACVALGVWLFLEPDYLGEPVSTFAKATLFLLAVVVAVPIWRSLAKVHPPIIKGLKLTKQDFPELHQALQELCTSLGSPKLETIMLTPETTISMISPLQLFGLGKQTHILRVGLPFFLAFTNAELKALFAHEIAHLSGSLNRVSRQIQFRLIAWNQIRDALAETSLLTAVISFFFDRLFIKPGEKLLFASQWAAELESDQLAARVVGNDEFALAYIKAETVILLTEMTFWSVIMKGFGGEPSPPANVYQQYDLWVRRLSLEEYCEALQWVLARKEVAALDHPPAYSRMERFYQKGLPEFDKLIHHVSTEVDEISLLGEKKDELINLLSRAWFEEKQLTWREQFRLRQHRIGNLPYWETVFQERELTEHELFDYTTGKASAAEANDQALLWEEFHTRFPNHAAAHFELACALEKLDAERALTLHFQLAEQNPWFRRKSLWNAYKLVTFQLNSPERKQFLNRILELIAELQTAQRQGQTLNSSDYFSPITPAQNEWLKSLFYGLKQFAEKTPRVYDCWVMEKTPSALPAYVQTVVAIRTRLFRSLSPEDQSELLALVDSHNVAFVLYISSPIQAFQWRRITQSPGLKKNPPISQK